MPKWRHNNNILFPAIRKCKATRHSKEHEYGGYLTPVEILALIKDYGVIPTQSYETMLDYIKEKMYKGICNPQWFYFFPSKKFRGWHERLNSNGMYRNV